jgi:soluble lytic murein transglycosylase-like protein
MLSGRSQEAEAIFIDALNLLEDSGESDPRVQTTLRNLVRLASIYQRLERPDDAARVMSYVDDYATLDGRDFLRSHNFVAHYESLNNQELEHAYRPAKANLNERRTFEPTVDALIRRTAHRYHVDRYLVKAIVAAESNFDALAVSEKGAQGLMQLMPATAQEMGVTTPFRPSENIRGGVRYLRRLLDRYPDLDRVIAAYNAGPVAVDRYKGVPPYPETQQYVKRVLRYYKEYRSEEGR